MSDDGPLLDAGKIRELLTELGARLEAQGLSARIFLVGGAAMALAINARRSTRDLDGVFEPKSAIYSEVAKMAEEHGLPPDWHNDSVKGLLPDKVGTEVGAHLDAPGISVEIASAEYLFAMKAKAAERASTPMTSRRLLAISSSEVPRRRSRSSSGSTARINCSLSPGTSSKTSSNLTMAHRTHREEPSPRSRKPTAWCCISDP